MQVVHLCVVVGVASSSAGPTPTETETVGPPETRRRRVVVADREPLRVERRREVVPVVVVTSSCRPCVSLRQPLSASRRREGGREPRGGGSPRTAAKVARVIHRVHPPAIPVLARSALRSRPSRTGARLRPKLDVPLGAIEAELWRRAAPAHLELCACLQVSAKSPSRRTTDERRGEDESAPSSLA